MGKLTARILVLVIISSFAQATLGAEETSSAATKSGASGTLMVQANPWANVTINGQFLNSVTPLKKQIPPGEYIMDVSQEGKKGQTKLTIESSKTTMCYADLTQAVSVKCRIQELKANSQS